MGLLMTTMRRSSLGSSADEWSAFAEASGERYGIDPSVILSIIYVESSGNPDARGAAGEVGLMQVMPATARMVRPGVTPDELRDPATNIDVGADYLATQLARYGGDLSAAISAYNAGTATSRNQSYVDRVLASLGYGSGAPTGAIAESRWDQATTWVREHPYLTGAGALGVVWLWRRR